MNNTLTETIRRTLSNQGMRPATAQAAAQAISRNHGSTYARYVEMESMFHTWEPEPSALELYADLLEEQKETM